MQTQVNYVEPTSSLSGKSKVTLGDRAFMYAAPKLWNNIPLFVRKSATLNKFNKTPLLINAM